MFITINRIEEIYNNDLEFRSIVDARLKDNDSKFMIMVKNVDDCLLHYNESFNISNFREYFFDIFNKLEDREFKFFIESSLKSKYNSTDKIYHRIVSEIYTNISEKYDIGIELVRENKSNLEKESESLFEKGDISKLFKVRRYLRENFKINGFNSFIRENKSLAIKILSDLDTDVSDKKFIRLEQLLKEHPGYLGTFTYFVFKLNISYERIKSVYERILKNRQIIGRLPRSVVEYRSFEHLEDDLTMLERNQVARVISTEYPRVGSSIRNNQTFIELANELKRMFAENPKFEEAYRKIFIPKVSLYRTEIQLIEALKKFITTNSDANDFADEISGYDDIKVVYDSENFLIVRYLDFEALRSTCSDTSWCIARDLDYWVQYHGDEGRIFLMILNKNKEKLDIHSKIGVTLMDGGEFNTAHLKNDQYISEHELNKILSIDNIGISLLYKDSIKFGDNARYDVDRDTYGGISGVTRRF